MSNNPIVYINETLPSGSIIIKHTEANHLIKVLRAKPGLKITVFNGTGNSWEAKITALERGQLTAEIQKQFPFEELPGKRLTMAVGVVKGNRMDFAIEKAAEIGVYSFIPMLTKFGVVNPGSGRLKHWERIAVSASKQSRRMRILRIEAVMEFSRVLENVKDTTIVYFDINKKALLINEIADFVAQKNRITAFIGPEGGFSEEECELLDSVNAKCLLLGKNILRTETAVAVGAGLLTHYLSRDSYDYSPQYD